MILVGVNLVFDYNHLGRGDTKVRRVSSEIWPDRGRLISVGKGEDFFYRKKKADGHS